MCVCVHKISTLCWNCKARFSSRTATQTRSCQPLLSGLSFVSKNTLLSARAAAVQTGQVFLRLAKARTIIEHKTNLLFHGDPETNESIQRNHNLFSGVCACGFRLFVCSMIFVRGLDPTRPHPHPSPKHVCEESSFSPTLSFPLFLEKISLSSYGTFFPIVFVIDSDEFMAVG